MVEICPYFGADDEQLQGALEPHPGHRCTVRQPPQSIPLTHQAQRCLTPTYHRCSRLTLFVPPPSGDPPAPAGRTGVQAPDLRPLRRSARPNRPQARPARRSPTVTELIVLGLGGAILLALLFSGYAIVYRFQLRSGIPAAMPGAPAAPAATLVPTFTPTAQTNPWPDPGQTVAPESATPQSPDPTASLRVPAQSAPSRLVIATISLDIPVQAVGTRTLRRGGATTLIWDDVADAGAFHNTSAYPGQGGNTVINGHRDILGGVFLHLDRVQVGDEVVVYVGDTAYPYTVIEIVVVPETFASAQQRADNLKYIGATEQERLTLVTCTPVGLATHRLLVIAEPPASVAGE